MGLRPIYKKKKNIGGLEEKLEESMRGGYWPSATRSGFSLYVYTKKRFLFAILPLIIVTPTLEPGGISSFKALSQSMH